MSPGAVKLPWEAERMNNQPGRRGTVFMQPARRPLGREPQGADAVIDLHHSTQFLI